MSDALHDEARAEGVSYSPALRDERIADGLETFIESFNGDEAGEIEHVGFPAFGIWGYAMVGGNDVEAVFEHARLAIDKARSARPRPPHTEADREAAIKGLEVAMLGTTDGDLIEPESEIPAGEMFRLARDYLEGLLTSGLIVQHDEAVRERTEAEASWLNNLRYAATALEGSADNGDRYCARLIRDHLAAADRVASEGETD